MVSSNMVSSFHLFLPVAKSMHLSIIKVLVLVAQPPLLCYHEIVSLVVSPSSFGQHSSPKKNEIASVARKLMYG